MCFQIDGTSSKADKCAISRILTKVIDCVFSIDTFEQACVVFKGMLQSPRLKNHVKILLNTDVFKTSRSYTNILGIMITNKNSKIFLSPLWFLILKYSTITAPDLP